MYNMCMYISVVWVCGGVRVSTFYMCVCMSV